jgi:hypothetical protein
MTSGHEKSVHRLAERQMCRLDKIGKGQSRFSIVDLSSGGRMRSSVPEHEYSFSLEEAEAWLISRARVEK